MSMTYQEALDTLALSADNQGDPTPEMVEATNVIVEQTRTNKQSRAYLDSTDWIVAKYNDEVVINAVTTDADFKSKYADVLTKRQQARDSIIR